MVFHQRSLLRTLQAAAAAVLLATGAVAAAGTAAQAATQEACDLYAAGGTPCVTAHSTTRALFGAYNGPLYQIQRAADQKYLDIGLLEAGGYANSAPQVTFCAGTRCTVTKIYDQTANHNDHTIGIENEGLYMTADVPGALFTSLATTCAWLCATYELDPFTAIVGHRDYVTTTVCPGDRLYARLPELRQRVATLVAG